MSAPQNNFRVLRPSHLKRGDVFAVQLPDLLYGFGRVICTDARWTVAQGAGPAALIYVYATPSDEMTTPGRDELRPARASPSPMMTNRSRGPSSHTLRRRWRGSRSARGAGNWLP